MRKIGIAALAGVLATAALAVSLHASAESLSKASAADSADAQARRAWREAIARTPAPEEACFHAAYPSTAWTKVTCTTGPNRPFLPSRSAGRSAGHGAETVGNGKDYAAEVTGLMTASVGSFPTVTGVTSERDGFKSNVYSIQLNSNFMTTAACNGTKGCLAWEQFVYSSSEKMAFMQYWLIDYGATCPTGWNTYSTDCWKNSAAVSVPKIAISELGNLVLSGTAVASGSDTLVFSTATDAYTTSGKDSVVYLATDWQESEFNIIGDGGGSKATFNSGSSLTVKIAVTDGTTNAPICASNAGTTGETNNLTLKSCTASGGLSPSMQFVESN